MLINSCNFAFVFYRRKLILALLQVFDGQLDKIRLQKLLFLFSLKQTKPQYDFVPYRYGCYSHSANADLTAMATRGMVIEHKNNFEKIDKSDYLREIKPDDFKHMQQVKSQYGKMSARALMKHTYINYPFYATKSEVASELLTEPELKIVQASKPKDNDPALFTIGYEGMSLEQYLVRLLMKNVKVLVDVRNNPLSMKYGFSKSQLKRHCEHLGIVYVHIPEVGIRSEQRRELNAQADYDELFTMYRKETLSKTIVLQQRILELLKENRRIALTCFEANICQCHRKHLAEAIETLSGFTYRVEHI